VSSVIPNSFRRTQPARCDRHPDIVVTAGFQGIHASLAGLTAARKPRQGCTIAVARGG
jgi:hypothetical protein